MLDANEDFETESDAKRAALYPNKTLIEFGYFEAGRRRRERSIL